MKRYMMFGDYEPVDDADGEWVRYEDALAALAAAAPSPAPAGGAEPVALTEEYAAAVSDLAKSQDMTETAVIRAAIRLYQAERHGTATVAFKREMSMLDDPAPTAQPQPQPERYVSALDPAMQSPQVEIDRARAEVAAWPEEWQREAAKTDVLKARLAAPAAKPGAMYLPEPFHKGASHIEPGYRDGWNACCMEALRCAQRTEAAGCPPVPQQPAVLTDEHLRNIVLSAPGGDPHSYAKAGFRAGFVAAYPGKDAQNAGRYMWLRDKANWDVLPVDKGTDLADWRCLFHSPYGMHDDTEDSLDAAIDAAIKAQGGSR